MKLWLRCRPVSSNSWDYWYSRKEREVEPEIPKLAETLAEKGRLRVLAFGCGTARHSLYFARKGFQVYGFDGYEKVVERARQLLQKEGLEADLRVHDMLKPLPYPNGFFDALLATRVIHHTLMQNIRGIIHEINRVLGVDGYVFLQVPEYGSHAWVLSEGLSTHRVLEPGTHAPIEGIEKDVPHHCFTKEELLGLFGNYEEQEIHPKSDHYGGFCLVVRKVRE